LVCVCVYTMQVMYKEGERLETCAHTGLCNIEQEREGRAIVVCGVMCVKV
jgi:hypothetical protein